MRFREVNEALGRIKTQEDGYRALSAAIVATACEDYIRYAEAGDTRSMQKVERFLLSDDFLLFSNGIEGAGVLRKLKDMHRSRENRSATSIPVQRLDENGDVLEEYRSVADAAWSVGADRRSIKRACDKNEICYGFYWRYAKKGD